MKRIFFSVGEPSGDLHGSNLIRHLHSINPDIECVGFGGPKMEAAGFDQHYDLTQHAVMMLWTVLKQLRFFFGLVDKAEEYFRNNQVDAVVLIDYPGFNWHIAKRAKRLGIPVFYYGVPQMWAWAPWRIRKLRKNVDHVLCKLPFEKKWFEDRGCKATYVGHPFFDELTTKELDQDFIDAFGRDNTNASGPTEFGQWKQKRTEVAGKPTIEMSYEAQGTNSIKTLLLLPGSRTREVRDNLPQMLSAARECQKRLPGLRVAIGCFNQKLCDMAKEQMIEAGVQFEAFVNRTPELMKAADVCIACSGSVSLELMYHRLPTVIVYKLNRFKSALQRVLIRSRYITLVNLLDSPKLTRDGIRSYNPDRPGAEEVPMPEYLSSRDRTMGIASKVTSWLEDDFEKSKVAGWLDRLTQKYGKPGASTRAAEYIASELGIVKQRARAA